MAKDQRSYISAEFPSFGGRAVINNTYRIKQRVMINNARIDLLCQCARDGQFSDPGEPVQMKDHSHSIR
ncbi:hypothetical protein [Halovulum sp. GXIMD14793]